MKVSPANLGLAIALLGVALIVYGAYLAYSAYVSYSPLLPKAQSLTEAITNTAYELLNLVFKIGFLGVMVWAGGILAKHGLSTVIEVHKVESGAVCSEQQKQQS